MNIYDLRKIIRVINFYDTPHFCTITYLKKETSFCFSTTRANMYKELEALGSLEEYAPIEERITYALSQWDAFNIVLRYELAKEQEKEIEASDLGKAIDKLKNK